MSESSRRHGALRERLHFQARGSTDDGFGNPVAGAFETQFTLNGHLRPLRGSETVMASRLEGRQPYVLTVRRTPASARVNEAWQAMDARAPGRLFAIVAPPVDPDGSNQWLEMLVVENGRS